MGLDILGQTKKRFQLLKGKITRFYKMPAREHGPPAKLPNEAVPKIDILKLPQSYHKSGLSGKAGGRAQGIGVYFFQFQNPLKTRMLERKNSPKKTAFAVN
jgi:hypothetical protein